jgi:hypothetical protein
MRRHSGMIDYACLRVSGSPGVHRYTSELPRLERIGSIRPRATWAERKFSSSGQKLLRARCPHVCRRNVVARPALAHRWVRWATALITPCVSRSLHRSNASSSTAAAGRRTPKHAWPSSITSNVSTIRAAVTLASTISARLHSKGPKALRPTLPNRHPSTKTGELHCIASRSRSGAASVLGATTLSGAWLAVIRKLKRSVYSVVAYPTRYYRRLVADELGI